MIACALEDRLSQSLLAFVSTCVQMFAGCKAAAGFSVGELTALIFAGALTLEGGKCPIQLVWIQTIYEIS